MQPFLLVHRQERERKSIIMNIKGSPMFHKKREEHSYRWKDN